MKLFIDRSHGILHVSLVLRVSSCGTFYFSSVDIFTQQRRLSRDWSTMYEPQITLLSLEIQLPTSFQLRNLRDSLCLLFILFFNILVLYIRVELICRYCLEVS